MGYKRYKMLQKYINGEPQEEYKQGELIDDTVYQTLDACNDGNQNPDKPIEGYIYQWVTVSGEYVCNDVNKYTKEKEQRSSDGGVTWTDTGRTRQGTLIEANSVDCGYVPTPPSDYSTQYLTFEAIEDGTFTFTGTSTNSLSYSLDDGTTWIPLASGAASPTITSGNKIMWKGITTPPNYGIGKFSSSGRFKTYGNIMSITYGDNFEGQTDLTGKDYVFRNIFDGCTDLINAQNLVLPATTLANGCYMSMFLGCTNLVNVPELPATTLTINCYNYMFRGCTSLVNAPVLPATTLAIYCYNNMFRGCTSLTTAPALPATTLVNYCYCDMFYNCTSLVNAPALPATTLTKYCYQSMFDGCSSLVNAPVLPATTLTEGCYALMFQNCRSLNNIKCLATDISATDCTYYWVNNIPGNGTFTKAASMTSWTRGVNGIPTNWTVINE